MGKSKETEEIELLSESLRILPSNLSANSNLKTIDISLPSQSLKTSGKFELRITYGLKKNRDSKYLKPCEDFLLTDLNNKVFIIMDGATRYVPKGQNYPLPSPASEASKIISTAAYDQIMEIKSAGLSPKDVLYMASNKANQALAEYNRLNFPNVDYLQNDFASACGIIAFIQQNTFHYIYLGDPQGIIVKENNLELFSNSQTASLEYFNQEALNNSKTNPNFVAGNVHELFRNKKHSQYPFGVFTGEKEALDFLEYGSIELNEIDQIILTSDGLLPVWETQKELFLTENISEIFSICEKIESENLIRSDDKSFIRILINRR